MKEERYLIKEAAALVGVESHVLRYWEVELNMDIHRNGMGHRYYTKKDVELLKKIRNLKDNGLQLRAIRNYLEMRREQIENETESETLPKEKDEQRGLVPVQQEILSNEAKMEQFQHLMNRIVSNAIQENNELIGKCAGEHAAIAMVNQMSGMTKEQEEKAEDRYRKLDETMREMQRARLEAAAANMRPVDRRKQARLKRKSKQIKQAQRIATMQENTQGEKDSQDE